MDYFIGLPLFLVSIMWSISEKYWWEFSNKTGVSFYWGFYISGRYKNLSSDQLDLISENAKYNIDPNVRRWANKVLSSYEINQELEQ